MALYADALRLPLVHAGKVRELYACPNGSSPPPGRSTSTLTSG
jgi:hypothetical protein